MQNSLIAKERGISPRSMFPILAAEPDGPWLPGSADKSLYEDKLSFRPSL
jgi:hypothetical protein